MKSTPTRGTPSPSLVISILALFVALSGSAVALTGKNRVDSNDLRKNVVHTKNIQNGAVKGGKVADESLSGADLAFDSVGAPEIVASAVGASEIATNGVDTPEIAFEAVTANEIAGNSIGSNKLVANSVTAEKIPSDAVRSSEIQSHAVNNAELAAGSVTVNKLDAVTGIMTVNFPAIDSGDCDSVTPIAPGATLTDNLIVTADQTFTSFVSWNARQGPFDGFITVSACNPTGSTFNPPSAPFRYIALHP